MGGRGACRRTAAAGTERVQGNAAEGREMPMCRHVHSIPGGERCGMERQLCELQQLMCEQNRLLAELLRTVRERNG